MNLAERLRLLRTHFGYSQAALAEKLSVSRMAYTQYETGHREPSLATLIILAQTYRISVDFLLGISDLSHLPNLSAQEKILLSQLDRLADERRQQVFRTLKSKLGEQILSDFSNRPDGTPGEDFF
ncbi:MAG: helix-turn-helix transcriptional regulator [Lachnospiraceae bacterium]|nr:helix-turn-helix transcriptional regulator [Lachnospiraceae bacterium]